MFFFKYKPACEMRVSDWISDVCSSDLVDLFGGKVCGGRAFEPVGIIGRAVGQMPRAEVARRLRLDLVDRGDQRVIAMLERAGQRGARVRQKPGLGDRKSTRLNSSH